METVRLLEADDTERLERFLARSPATTMFLRSNLRAGGMSKAPRERYEGAYAGVFDDARLVSVVGHFWNGMLLMQGDVQLSKAARLVSRTTGGAVTGLTGDLDFVEKLRSGLGLADVPCTLDSDEYLYELPLADLVMPGDGAAICRPPQKREFEQLVKWRAAYFEETLGDTWSSPGESIRGYVESGTCRVLEVESELVAYTHFNAQLPDIVQVGGVWTPPERRGRGHARAVVAGHLAEASADGVERAILFTAAENVPAQRAYEAIGFRRIGDYGLVLFEEPVQL